jgi:ribosomal protein L7/L12
MTGELSDDQVRQVTDALAGGSKIEAIKLYREFTGKGLADAKMFIDQLIPKLIEQDPTKYASLSQKSTGCASLIMIGLIITVLLYWLGSAAA